MIQHILDLNLLNIQENNYNAYIGYFYLFKHIGWDLTSKFFLLLLLFYGLQYFYLKPVLLYTKHYTYVIKFIPHISKIFVIFTRIE